MSNCQDIAEHDTYQLTKHDLQKSSSKTCSLNVQKVLLIVQER